MKPSYSTFEAKKSSGFLTLPPAGAYEAVITGVRLLEPDGDKQLRTVIELMLEITTGEYANRYGDLYREQSERFDGKASYKGIFRLTPPEEDDEDWRKRAFEGSLWCVEQSNPNYSWDWDEKKLKGKKVGISVRDRLYTYNDTDRQTTEIGRFETIEDVRAGKVKPMNPRDQRKKDNPVPDGGFFDASNDPDVPWG